METILGKLVISIVIVVIGRWGWKLLNWVWLKPRKVEKWLRSEGYKGNSYKLMGDIIGYATMMNEARSKAIPMSHDITQHVLPFDYHILNKYGKKSFIWLGPTPRINIMDPELLKEIMLRPNDFQKPHPEPIRETVVGGLLVSEGHIWTKNRHIINPAFHFENIKCMFPAICLSTSNMIEKWELLTAGNGHVEVDVWPFIDNLAGDVISRTAFGSSWEEGHKIFRIQKEQMDITLRHIIMISLPGGRYLPTKANKKLNENDKKVQALLQGIIDKRKKLMSVGEGRRDDLLGMLLESNTKKIKEDGVGMTMEEVMEECKFFYVAGSDTTSNLIAWTMVCLSVHQEWQTKAREEIMEVFGTKVLHFEGLKNLKIVTMILNEVLRLYPPATMVVRATTKETKLGNMMIPAGVQISIPIMYVHHDRDIWGEDATDFKPERFSKGIAHATKGRQSSFLPFVSGPRVCIGQNFAMTEAKVSIAMILQRFSFDLSPSYKHAPFPVFTLPPQSGVHLILRNV